MTEATENKGMIARDETFDDFLAGEGLLADTEEQALKEIIADQVLAAMDAGGLSILDMAARMHADPRQLDGLLDPQNGSVSLSTLRRAASAVGRSLKVEFV